MKGEPDEGHAETRLFAITDAERFPNFIAQSENLCASARAGSIALVLRERQATGRQLYGWATELRSISSRYGQRLFVADRVDLASLVHADGVHLPTRGFSPSRIDPGAGLEVSRGGHDLHLLSDEDWSRLGAVLVSPVFETRKGRPALGADGLREQVARIRARAAHVRVYALGGVRPERVTASDGARAAGVAAIGSVWEGDPTGLLQALRITR